MASDSKARKYLQTQIATASSEQLLLMLYDGAIRFLGIARENLNNEDASIIHENLIRVQRIVIE